MLDRLERIANEIANSRTRLSCPMLGEQTRQDIIDEAKRLKKIELDLRMAVYDLKNKVSSILDYPPP